MPSTNSPNLEFFSERTSRYEITNMAVAIS
jgi:hypothetical protein